MANLTYEQALAKLYTKAEANLIKTIRRKTAHGNATTYERALLRQVDEQIKALQKSSDKLVRKLVRSNYKKGLDKLVKDLAFDTTAPQHYNFTSPLNTNQINIIVDNITQQLNIATATVGRRYNDLIRQVSLEAMAQKLTQGKTIREMQKELEKRLQNQNITSVTYSNGTKHNIKDYASMVARTTTAETQNTAQFVQGKDWGYDLVHMTSHFPTCSVCAMYQGRVYATTKEAANGKYKDKNGNPLRFSYLYDTVLVKGYDTVHPNCRHRFSIFPPKAYTLDELAEFSRQSIQPFVDNRSNEERKAYAKEQAVKRKRNASRRQYEKIKSCFPDKAPKTFAGWQRMKSAKSQRYKDLLKDYRNLQKTVANSDGNGIINLKDNGDLYKPVTLSSVSTIPRMNIFANSKLNTLHRQASRDLLVRVAKTNPVGTEISIVYDKNMNRIEGYGYVVGRVGTVKIENPNLQHHAFHNHGSGETFSFSDLTKFSHNPDMISLTAQGNNGNKYVIMADKDSDKDGYNSLLYFMGNEVIYSVNQQKFTLNYLYGKNTMIEAQKIVYSLKQNQRDELEKAIIKITEDCLSRGDDYGIKYYKTKVVD